MMSIDDLKDDRRLRRPSLLSLRQQQDFHPISSPDLAMSPLSSSRTSHIQRLPPEVLGIIFCYSIPTTPEFVEPSIRTAPLLLCRVCRYWRELAERTPELWSSICLFLLRPYERATRAFETWIARSGNSPLRIKIVVMSNSYSAYEAASGHNNSNGNIVLRNGGSPATSATRIQHEQHQQPQQQQKTKNLLREFIRNLAKQSYRWLVADIAVPGCFMQCLLANEAPMLRKLTLSDPLLESEGWRNSDVPSALSLSSSYTWEHTFALSAAPALLQLVVKQRLRILPGTFSQHPLTSVQFEAFSTSQVVDLFDGCPMLEELGITIKREVRLLLHDGPETWTFPKLHTLRVWLHHGDNDRHRDPANSVVLSRLHLPALRNLSVDGLVDYRGERYLRTLLDHTEGGLGSLTLVDTLVSYNRLLEYLQRTPRLRTLHLVDSRDFDSECLRQLTWAPGLNRPNVCPRLEEFWILRSECSALHEAVVENFVVSRSRSPCPCVEDAEGRGGGGGMFVCARVNQCQGRVMLDPEPLREFRFDGSKAQHEKLLARPRIKAAIDNGLVWKK